MTKTAFSDFVFDEFMQKYGLKNVTERKFAEFIQSLLYYQDKPRITSIIKCMNMGQLISIPN